jgi:hypothetical protein
MKGRQMRANFFSLRWLVAAILIVGLAGMAGCDPDDEDQIFVLLRRPTPAPTTAPTRTPTRVPTPKPTATPKPTPTPSPAGTATPSPTPTLAPEACLPSSSISVLVAGTDAIAYVPDGRWGSSVTGVEVVPIETSGGIGTGGAVTTVGTPNSVNSCSSNSSTGQTVCTANNTDVYLITGSTLASTLTSGSNATQSFSGGSCNNCGVVVDSSQNKALITMGFSPNGPGAYQFLDLGATPPVFEPPIPAGTATTFQTTSEDASIDPIRHLVLSPNEQGNYQILDISAGTEKAKIFNNNVTGNPEFDSAGEDCTTGIALGTIEFTGDLFIADLTQATFDSATGTWSDAASQVQNFPEFAPLAAGTCGIAVAPGTHIGLVTGEFGGNVEGVIQLPATSGTGVPAVLDWVQFTLPTQPDGTPFSLGFDPHTVTAYVSPNSGKPLGVLTSYSGGTPHFLAVADLNGLLAAPRTGHTVNTPLPPGLITYVLVH